MSAGLIAELNHIANVVSLSQITYMIDSEAVQVNFYLEGLSCIYAYNQALFIGFH